MADKKISALTASSTPLAGTEVLPIVQGGSTVKVAVSNLTAGRAVTASSLALNTATATGVLTAVTPSSAGTSIANWANYVSVGPNVGSTTGSGLGLGYNTGTDQAEVAAIAPGVGWKPIAFYSKGFVVNALEGGEAFRVSDTGNATVSTGNLVVGTAGKGIDFSANSHAAGMTSELLNWYEEGNYTPTVAATTGSITSYTATAFYTRIGRQVTVTSFVTITNAGTGAATLTITLPFAASGSIAFSGTGRENAVTGNALQANITAGGNVMNVVQYNNLTVIATNAQVRSTVTYFV